MKFVHPFWLWGILILPFAFWAILNDEKRRQKQFTEFAHERLWAFIAPERDGSARLRKGVFALLGLGFLFLALAQPQFGSHEEIIKATGLDIMIALDVSNSMDVEDVIPSRLQKAKHIIRNLTGNLEGDRVGLVAFAASSYVACPLTTDLDYFLNTVQIMSPKTIQNQGTDIGAALETALRSIERGAQDVAPQVNGQTGPISSRVILLISDGEDHEDQAFKIAKEIKAKGAKLFILGIGTEKGGPIPLREGNQTASYKRDRKGQPIISTFHSEFLEKLAASTDGKYWQATDSEAEIQEFLKDIGVLDRSDYAERKYLVYEDRFQIPLLIAIILFFLEISVSLRKSPAIAHLLIISLISSPLLLKSKNAKADLSSSPSQLDTYLNNKKGLKAYQEANLDEAQKDFGAAQARDPRRPELQFNQGVVQLQKGDLDNAIEAFKNSTRGAQEKQDLNLTSKSLYNLGNALGKKGNKKEAIQSYLGAIQSAAQAHNQVLEEQARKNLQLLVKEQQKQQEQKQQQQKEQQPKEQQQDKKNQEQNQKNQEKDQQQQNKQQDKLQDQKQDQNQVKQYQETKRDKGSDSFQSKKMDAQDAERVLNELKNRERELQEKLNTQNGRAQNNSKDW